MDSRTGNDMVDAALKLSDTLITYRLDKAARYLMPAPAVLLARSIPEPPHDTGVPEEIKSMLTYWWRFRLELYFVMEMADKGDEMAMIAIGKIHKLMQDCVNNGGSDGK